LEHAVVMEGVTKTFGDKHAVHELDLAVPRGSICGFIGPNGAGKTTTMRMILSIISPDTGTLRVLGRGSAAESKDRIGYLPEERGLYRKMKVEALLSYVARLKGMSAEGLQPKIARWLDRVELPGQAHRRCEELSKGMQQKVQFLAAVIHEPDLLVLDEPFSGLDPLNARLLEELMLEQHARGATILLSTHVMSQAERLCERVLMIHRGKKVLDASTAEIARSFDPRTLVVELASPDEGVEALASYAGAERIDQRGVTVRVLLREGVDSCAAIRDLTARARLRRIEAVRATLEEVFLRLAGVPESEALGAASQAGTD
jgi:ABC-2 type transport system ATP-binding protein